MGCHPCKRWPHRSEDRWTWSIYGKTLTVKLVLKIFNKECLMFIAWATKHYWVGVHCQFEVSLLGASTFPLAFERITLHAATQTKLKTRQVFFSRIRCSVQSRIWTCGERYLAEQKSPILTAQTTQANHSSVSDRSALARHEASF